MKDPIKYLFRLYFFLTFAAPLRPAKI